MSVFEIFENRYLFIITPSYKFKCLVAMSASDFYLYHMIYTAIVVLIGLAIITYLILKIRSRTCYTCKHFYYNENGDPDCKHGLGLEKNGTDIFHTCFRWEKKDV